MERAPNDLKELAKLSDQYLKARGKQLYREFKKAPDDSKTVKFLCTNCKKPGHKIQDCRWLKNEKTKDKPRCFSCGKEGHFQRDCRVKKIKSAVSVEKEADARKNWWPDCDNTERYWMQWSRSQTKFVNESQYTGRFAYMVLADNTLRKAPIVNLNVQTPFYCGEIQAIAPPDALYDLMIGNVEGAREPNDPDLNWDRTENNMEVKHTESIISADKDEETKISASSITKDDLIKLQKADSIIQSKISNNSKDYVVEDEVVYRIDMNTENQNKQVVVPDKLRNYILKLGYESKMSCHLGNKRPLTEFEATYIGLESPLMSINSATLVTYVNERFLKEESPNLLWERCLWWTYLSNVLLQTWLDLSTLTQKRATNTFWQWSTMLLDIQKRLHWKDAPAKKLQKVSYPSSVVLDCHKKYWPIKEGSLQLIIWRN